MLNKIILTKPRPRIQLTEIIFSNYNFANDFTDWGVGGSYAITNEGLNNSKCAKLFNTYSGLYRSFAIEANNRYKFDILMKPTTTTNLQIVLRNSTTNADISVISIPNEIDYIIKTIEFTVNLTSIRLGFEVFPGSGQMLINEVRLFKY